MFDKFYGGSSNGGEIGDVVLLLWWDMWLADAFWEHRFDMPLRLGMSSPVHEFNKDQCVKSGNNVSATVQCYATSSFALL